MWEHFWYHLLEKVLISEYLFETTMIKKNENTECLKKHISKKQTIIIYFNYIQRKLLHITASATHKLNNVLEIVSSKLCHSITQFRNKKKQTNRKTINGHSTDYYEKQNMLD